MFAAARCCRRPYLVKHSSLSFCPPACASLVVAEPSLPHSSHRSCHTQAPITGLQIGSNYLRWPIPVPRRGYCQIGTGLLIGSNAQSGLEGLSTVPRRGFSQIGTSLHIGPNIQSSLEGLSSPVPRRVFSQTVRRGAIAVSEKEKGEVVYRGAITGMIRAVKIFSLSTSVLGLAMQPLFFTAGDGYPTGLRLVMVGVLNFMIFANPAIIHYIAKKYVTDLRLNRSTGLFTASTFSFFATRREIRFTPNDVRVPAVPGMFTFLEVKGVPLFMDPKAFTDQASYVRLMGYDKPLEWELPVTGKQSEDSHSKR